MFAWALKKVFGTSHEREIRRLRPRVEAINALEGAIAELSDAELRGKTAEFKQKLDNGATLDDILDRGLRRLPRGGQARAARCATTTCSSSAAWCSTTGSIAEMRTGEGKTLVATLPCYLNALEGKGVHVVTVNDYLARRDAEWMGKLYNFLGLSDWHRRQLAGRAREEGRVPLRHHLRPEQRVRLRLPARQHEVQRARLRAARAQLRDRRRGRLDPHRRGAHAAHHQRPGRAVEPQVPARSTRSSRACARTSTTSSTRRRTRSRSPTTASSSRRS